MLRDIQEKFMFILAEGAGHILEWLERTNKIYHWEGDALPLELYNTSSFMLWVRNLDFYIFSKFLSKFKVSDMNILELIVIIMSVLILTIFNKELKETIK